MTVLAYPPSSILADYGRAGFGLAIVGTPLLLAETGPAVTAVLAAGAVVFAVYAVRTLCLHLTRIELDAEGVMMLFPRTGRIRWRDIRGFRLAYYSTRRDKEAGWFQLTLIGDGTRVRLDSRVEGFEALAARAAAAAAANGVKLDAATTVNLDAMGAVPPLHEPLGARP